MRYEQLATSTWTPQVPLLMNCTQTLLVNLVQGGGRALYSNHIPILKMTGTGVCRTRTRNTIAKEKIPRKAKGFQLKEDNVKRAVAMFQTTAVDREGTLTYARLVREKRTSYKTPDRCVVKRTESIPLTTFQKVMRPLGWDLEYEDNWGLFHLYSRLPIEKYGLILQGYMQEIGHRHRKMNGGYKASLWLDASLRGGEINNHHPFFVGLRRNTPANIDMGKAIRHNDTLSVSSGVFISTLGTLHPGGTGEKYSQLAGLRITGLAAYSFG